MDQLQQEMISSIYNSGYSNGYNRAIDDFVKLAKEHDFKYGTNDISKSVVSIVEFFAELLKEGEMSGTDNQ